MQKLNDLVLRAESAQLSGNNFIDKVKPLHILAIADAFRALEQRAEDAAYAQLAENVKEIEASYLRDIRMHIKTISDLQQREEAAEAYAKSLNYIIGLRESDLMAAEAELVPDEAMPDENNTYEWVDGWNACRSAILHRSSGRKPE